MKKIQRQKKPSTLKGKSSGAGVNASKGTDDKSYTVLCSTADCAAIRMLKTYPNLKTVYLCLDHDSAGIEGAYRVAESIHALGDYTVWRKMSKNKDWDEDLKALHGRTAIPSAEHTKLERYRKTCSEFLTDACMETDAWMHIAEAKGYASANFLSLLRSEMDKAESATDTQTEQAHLRAMAVRCLAFCFCRERQTGNASSFDRYADAVRYSASNISGENRRRTFFGACQTIFKIRIL